MQNTVAARVRLIALAISSLASISAIANENIESTNTKEETTRSECFLSDLSGSLTFGYDSNLYDKNDYRSERNLSWDMSLNYKIDDKYKLYFATSAYRALEDKTGDFWNDSIIGLSHDSIYSFGETGQIGLGGQLTLPTSEASQDDDLITAVRISVPVSIELWGADLSLSPRLRKNFHRYKTAGGRSLTEWIYSLYLAADYSWEKLATGISFLGANTVSYQGTRRNTFDYGASAYISYQFTNVISGELGASSSGFYTDAERGTLGDLDLFDADKAVFNASVSFTF
ncbi:hypothetical protein [Photobacterium sp. J15]|uniref:hypothetical protein n=1 Tax=Photobacterium sp. J15 TaxID=265901 RepID=UPI0007E4054E|nr:hypothetical protein [Photobacterium sp. J15]